MGRKPFGGLKITCLCKVTSGVKIQKDKFLLLQHPIKKPPLSSNSKKYRDLPKVDVTPYTVRVEWILFRGG